MMTKYRLLIVDDEELIRRGLYARIDSFRISELEIDDAGSGSEALEKFAQQRVDIALVDISMPDMSGLELIERAKQINPDAIFILLSGHAEFSYAQRAIQLRVRAYLNKPVSNEILREHLEAAVEELKSSALSGAGQQDRTVFDPERELNEILGDEVPFDRMAELCPGLCRRYPGLADGTGRIRLAIVHLGGMDDEGGALSGSRLNEIRAAVREIFDQTPCGCERLIVNSYQNPRRLYAVFMNDGRPGMRSLLEIFFLRLHPEVERRVGVRITMGVSRMTSRLGADCVNESRIALRQRFVQGRSNIYFYEDVAEIQSRPFPEAELELLRKFMEREDRDGVHRQLKRLLSEEQMENRRTVYLHALCVRIAGMVMRMYSDMDMTMLNRLLSQVARVETMAFRDVVQMLTALLDDCLSCGTGREMSTASKIDYAISYIREHFDEEIVINDLAAKLDMSPGYFSSMFKREVGQSTMQYVTALRMERAKEYLADTQLSVAVIAKNIGYADGQYFYRVFKKITGMTPLQYRQKIRPE